MGENKGSRSAIAVLLVLVMALGFFAGQSSARSWTDFASLIQGGTPSLSIDPHLQKHKNVDPSADRFVS